MAKVEFFPGSELFFLSRFRIAQFPSIKWDGFFNYIFHLQFGLNVIRFFDLQTSMLVRERRKNVNHVLIYRNLSVTQFAQFVSKGKFEMAKQIIMSDLSLVHATDYHSMTPLHHVSRHSCQTLAKFLIKRGALMTERDRKGWNCLHLAGSTNENMNLNISFSHFLLNKESANRALKAKTDFGSTYLHILLWKKTIPENDLSTLLRTCIQLNADVDAQDRLGQSPLHLAALYGRADICRILVSEAGFF